MAPIVIKGHDESTSYCTSLPEHGDMGHWSVGATRACPDCQRPQHYTGHENGWAHDAAIDMMRCGASPGLLAELEK